jgi:predicted nucleic acid-binding Zn finger protein
MLDSLRSFYSSIFKKQVYILDNGFCTGTYELKHASEIGHRKCCLDIESGFAKSYTGKFKYTDGTSSFEPYKNILELAYRNNIKITFFISPTHARLLEVLNKACGYDKFEIWKRQLVLINEKIAKKYGKQAIVIWDFSGYNNFTTEEVPTINDTKSQMKYYYESSHYKPILGDIVLDRILDGNFSGGQNYPDFGVKLTSQNIEAHLLKLRNEREQWHLTHPQDVKEIEALKKKQL